MRMHSSTISSSPSAVPGVLSGFSASYSLVSLISRLSISLLVQAKGRAHASRSRRRYQDLSQDISHHVTGNIGEPVVPARVTERELGVVEAQGVEDCGVEIMHVAFVLRNLEAE